MESKAKEANEEIDDAKITFFSRSTKNRYGAIIVALAILLVVVSAVAVVFVALYATESASGSDDDSSSSSSSSTSSNVCQTDACFDVAVQILGAMDEEVDPCEDFYNFTCGNWAAFKGVPLDGFGTSALSLQQVAVYNDLIDVFETDFTGGNKILQELKDLYSSCLAGVLLSDEEVVENLIPDVRNVYKNLGGWDVVDIPGDGTEWDINSIQFIREKRFGSDAFYSISVGFDQDEFEFTMEIDQAGLTLGSPFLYYVSNITDELDDLIVVYLTGLAGLTEPTDDILTAAADIVELETQLATIWGYDFFGDFDSVNVTVEELFLLWPDHDWLTVLQGVFQPSGVEIELSSIVHISNLDYFKNLTNVIGNVPNEVLENYAKWQLTWEISEIFLPDENITNALIHFKKALAKPTMEEKQECVSFVDMVMPIALGRVYAEHILPSDYKEAGMKLVTEVTKGLRERMMEVDWLDSTTRRRAIEKLDAIESRVAYPERTFDDNYLESLYSLYQFDENDFIANAVQFYNLSHRIEYSFVYKPLDRSEWLVSPATVNAYYIAVFNQISILEAIMRTPTFSTEWPLSMQYGALGVVVGHELTHGFDNNGRRYDKDGRRRMWWTMEAIRNFKDRSECFVDQYDNYELFGFQVDGNMTLGENIADNGGVSASYDAYQNINRNGQILPGLTEYSDDQLFYIAYAQLWCTYYDAQTFFIQTIYGVHSPGPFRVIGSVSNSKEFAEAFNCPANAPMNPPDKCELW